MGKYFLRTRPNPHDAVRFLKKRHYFTQHGVIVAAPGKYVEELVELYDLGGYQPKSTPDMVQGSGDNEELDPQEAHLFRSAMGTLLYLSADRWDIQHSVRHLAQWMAKPTRLAKAGVRHVILYLAGMKSYAMLLPYKVVCSKLDSIHGRDGTQESCEKVEVFMDSDWAGDQSSSTTRRSHSVSCAVIFLNG